MSRAAGALLLGLLAIGALTVACRDAPNQDGASGATEGHAETLAVDSPSMGDDSLSKATLAEDSLSKGSLSEDSLSGEDRKKLDHALRLLLREGPENPFFSYQAHRREDGTVAYGVLIRTTDPSALRPAGLPVGAAPDVAVPDGRGQPDSNAAQVVTTRLTTGEIRLASRLEAVVSISNPSEAKPH